MPCLNTDELIELTFVTFEAKSKKVNEECRRKVYINMLQMEQYREPKSSKNVLSLTRKQNKSFKHIIKMHAVYFANSDDGKQQHTKQKPIILEMYILKCEGIVKLGLRTNIASRIYPCPTSPANGALKKCVEFCVHWESKQHAEPPH
jgi:hypothetical protein